MKGQMLIQFVILDP